MTETKYIIATNRAKISMALAILRDVSPGDDYGITDAKLKEIISRLSQAQDKLFASYTCKED